VDPEAVVVTGIGVVTPLGVGKTKVWSALLAGENGIRPMQGFDTSGFRIHCGGEVLGFSAAPWFRVLDPEEVGRGAHLAVAAARLALEDAELDSAVDGAKPACSPGRAAVVLGTTMGEWGLVEEIHRREREAGYRPQRRKEKRLETPQESLPARVAHELGFAGSRAVFVTACAAGNYAVGHGADLLTSRRADLVLAGGVDPFSRTMFAGFQAMYAVTPDKCRPFDRHRKGIAVSEGAGILALERWEDARRRGARVYAQVSGYGLANDAHSMTSPHPEGRGAQLAMKSALAAARVHPEQVGYISAHGTGTQANDRVETLAIKAVFGERARRIPVSSVKSMLGHTMGAASAIDAAVCCLALYDRKIPPTMHYATPDPECDLDYVPNCARESDSRVALNNAFGFGGNCAVLVLEAVC
jgi:3-oxoacyl-[acyl-carrier-protein] synthase II